MTSSPVDYVTFGRSGLRISPFVYGGGGLGNGLDDELAGQLLDRYIERGGNFIDIAEVYGNSEAFLGDYMRSRGNRERLVVGTKYHPNIDWHVANINASGNGRKNMQRAVDKSLRLLGTDYIDMYWMHVWDRVTPVEEVVDAMDILTRQGKILYYGLSNVPAWYVARACSFADTHGKARPIGLELQYSLIERNIERELIPVAQECGLAICAYSPLGEGFLTGKYRREGDSFAGDGKLEKQKQAGWAFLRRIRDQDWTILDTLNRVAAEIGRKPVELALAWVAQRPGITAPILGASRLEQLDGHFESLALEIPSSTFRELNRVSALEPQYPFTMHADDFRPLMEGGKSVRRWQPDYVWADY